MRLFGKTNLLLFRAKQIKNFFKKSLDPLLEVPGKTILLREWFFFILIFALTLLVMISYIFESLS